jgi:succinate dehydrogenase / fumarate reductase, cytochrome b subunit
MKRITSFYNSTLGKKILMALSGAFLVFFVVGHMAGNLKIFLGKDAAGVHALDHYAHYLREIAQDILGPSTFLWIFRVLLISAVLIHVSSAIALARRNRQARPVGYQKHDYRSSTIASRTMYYGGLVIIAFIVFHILHFTTGHLHFRGFIEGKVYHNVYYAFKSFPIVLFYLVSMMAIGLHLFHGSWSMFQTLGLDSPSFNPSLRLFAKVLAAAVFLGFTAVPLAIYLNFLPHP